MRNRSRRKRNFAVLLLLVPWLLAAGEVDVFILQVDGMV